MANINEVLLDGSMFLEPRLQQYIEKKKYYKKHNIETESSLEKEYNISNNDIRLIKDYMNGKKNYYKHDKKDQYLDLIDTTGQKFAGMNFKDDERYKRFQKKMERNKTATQQRHNYSEWDDGFTKLIPDESSSQPLDRSATSGRKTIDSSSSTRKLDDRFFSMQKQTDNIHNPYKSNSLYEGRNIKYNDTYENMFDSPIKNNNLMADNIIGRKKTYAKSYPNDRYEYENHLDSESKRNNMSINQKGKKYHNTSSYTPVPHSNSDIIKDINIENNLRTGEDVVQSDYTKYRVNSKAKTIGYPNPNEHYYDYIYSNNITNSTLPYPKNTRDDNNKSRKQLYKRDVM